MSWDNSVQHLHSPKLFDAHFPLYLSLCWQCVGEICTYTFLHFNKQNEKYCHWWATSIHYFHPLSSVSKQVIPFPSNCHFPKTSNILLRCITTLLLITSSRSSLCATYPPMYWVHRLSGWLRWHFQPTTVYSKILLQWYPWYKVSSSKESSMFMAHLDVSCFHKSGNFPFSRAKWNSLHRCSLFEL